MDKDLKEKMLKNAEIMLGRDLIDDGIDCYDIRCKECPMDKKYNISHLDKDCIDSGRSEGKTWLQNWYNNNNNNNNKEEKMEELQVIDATKWQWMMVSCDGENWKKRICFGKIFDRYLTLDNLNESAFLQDNKSITYGGTSTWGYAKPIEKRKNTNLDVMWWGGVRRVVRCIDNTIECDEHLITSVDRLTDSQMSDDEFEYNELHLVNGHAELKHDKWLTADELEIV